MIRKTSDGTYVDIVDYIAEEQAPKDEPDKTIYWVQRKTLPEFNWNNPYDIRVYYLQRLISKYPAISLKQAALANSLGRSLKSLSRMKKTASTTGVSIKDIIDAYLEVQDQFVCDRGHPLHYIETSQEEIRNILKRRRTGGTVRDVLQSIQG